MCKGIVGLIVVRLKLSTPFAAQAIPQASQANQKVTFNGQWLAEKISDNINSPIEIGPSVRGIVTDNHSANASQCVFSSEKYSVQNQIVV